MSSNSIKQKEVSKRECFHPVVKSVQVLFPLLFFYYYQFSRKLFTTVYSDTNMSTKVIFSKFFSFNGIDTTCTNRSFGTLTIALVRVFVSNTVHMAAFLAQHCVAADIVSQYCILPDHLL